MLTFCTPVHLNKFNPNLKTHYIQIRLLSLTNVASSKPFELEKQVCLAAFYRSFQATSSGIRLSLTVSGNFEANANHLLERDARKPLWKRPVTIFQGWLSPENTTRIVVSQSSCTCCWVSIQYSGTSKHRTYRNPQIQVKI